MRYQSGNGDGHAVLLTIGAQIQPVVDVLTKVLKYNSKNQPRVCLLTLMSASGRSFKVERISCYDPAISFSKTPSKTDCEYQVLVTIDWEAVHRDSFFTMKTDVASEPEFRFRVDSLGKENKNAK